jgi:hypothetical protein
MIKSLLLLVVGAALSACGPKSVTLTPNENTPDKYGVVCYIGYSNHLSCVKVMETEATMANQLKLMKEMLK